MQITVGVADIKTANQPDEVLVTYSLGSCLGVIAYDPVNHVAGMLHCMLPLSQIDTAKAKTKPAMFTDTGMTVLLRSIFDLGAQKKNLIVKVAGGSLLLDEKKLFMIGERNFTVLRKVLWKNNIMIKAQDVGGSKSRTLYHYMDSGRSVIKSQGVETEL